MLAMVAATLWVFALAWQTQKAWQFFLLGFLATLSLEVHMVGIAFWGSYGGVLGLHWLWNCWQRRRLDWPHAVMWFVLGSVIPAGVFLVTHILPDIGKPSAIILSPTGFNLFGKIEQELTRWYLFCRQYPLECIIAVWAIGYAIQRRARGALLILSFLSLLVLAYVFVAPTHWEQYTRYFLPVLVLLIALMLVGDEERRLHPVFALVVVSFFFGQLVALAPDFLPRAFSNGIAGQATPAIVEYVEDTIPPDETVVMNMYYYLFLEDGHRYDYRHTGMHPQLIEMLGGPPEDTFYPLLDPAIIVLDGERDVHNQWMDAYLQSGRMIAVDQFNDQNLEVYVRSDLLPADSQ
jgi:hypothetical protein